MLYKMLYKMLPRAGLNHLVGALAVEYLVAMFLAWLAICSTNLLAIIAKSVIFFLLVKLIHLIRVVYVRGRLSETSDCKPIDVGNIDCDNIGGTNIDDNNNIDHDDTDDELDGQGDVDDSDDLDPYGPDTPYGATPMEQKVIMIV